MTASRMLAFAAVLLGLLAGIRVGAAECFVYVGTYTDWELFGPPRRNPSGERSQGIYVFRFDLETGKLSARHLAAATDNPTYVTFSPSGNALYAVNEIYRFRGESSAAVSAFAIDRSSGRLTLLNQQPARGTGACHAVVDATGRNLLVANFGSGSVAVFPLTTDEALRPLSAFVQHTGSGPNPRQAGPHAHAINLSPDNRFAIASEFGVDRLLVYRFDASAGTLAPADPPHVTMQPGSAPRHLAFHPAGRVAYSLNEIDSTLTALRYEPEDGLFEIVQNVSTLPADYRGRNTAAEVIVHPGGKFLYASNRGHHSIAVFAIDDRGTLSLRGHVPCGGRTPRGFSVDPTGRWLIAANQDTHGISVFALDPATGFPKPTGETAEVRTPVGVKFLILP